MGVNQSAMAHITAVAVVTPRWPNLNPAQTIKGTSTKVRPKSPPNTTYVARMSSVQKIAPASTLRLVHTTVSGAAQLNRRGAITSIPELSPCHHIHQFQNRSAPLRECVTRRGSKANVGAMAALNAASATNLITSGTRAKRFGIPTWRRMSAEATTDCRALTAAIVTVAKTDASILRFG